MLKENPANTFRIHGTVVRDPQIFRNRDGSIKVAMTIAAEDESPRPDGGKSFQYLPVETFYGRRYVETYGDGVKDSVRKGDVVSASGRIEMHSWNGTSGPQAKLVLFCLDTPVVVTPAEQPANGSVPYVLHMSDGTVTGQGPSGHASSPQHAAAPSSPDPPLPDPVQLQGSKDSMPYVLHYLPPGPAPGALPDGAIRQLPGPATTMPFVLHPIGTCTTAALPVPDGAIRQLPGPPTSMPFLLHPLDGRDPPAPYPASAHAGPVPDGTVRQLPGPPTSMPFRLNMLPASGTEIAAVADSLSRSDDGLPFIFGDGSVPEATDCAVFDTTVIEHPVTSPAGAPGPARRLDDYVSGASMAVASGSAIRSRR